MPELTPKQATFVREYLVDLNATQAAIRAGYSERTAHSQGQRLLNHVEVAAAIAERQGTRLEELDLTADKVLRELASIAFTDLADVAEWGEREVAIGYDADGKRLAPADIGDAVVVHHEMAPYLRLKDSSTLTKAQRAAVSEVALTKDGFKIRMHSKTDAAGLLARHFGLLVDKREVSGPNGGPIRVQTELVALLAGLSPEERALLKPVLLKLEGRTE
ncbi:MAG: terminase small subunit [Phenylobacterium sp.]|uniref:terminase small subunit n=1 Tax=Phenylobacterium sp. TaxID=1871053 RepID=UPI001A4494B4|nr:terminase small subunit [Phenylobacterium sp.]MBL8773891.1 terminase small subunit [Phenylobacterium sp.]